MTDEKKSAMLERLAKGRETRANNLLAKKGLSQKIEEIKEPVKDKRIESLKKEKDVNNSEEERKSFINTMVGKSKPVEKFERPKKKIRTEGSDEQPKQIIIEAPKIEAPKVEAEQKVLKVEAPKVQVPIKQNLVVEKPKKIEGYAPPKVVAPVVFSTLKKPMWG